MENTSQESQMLFEAIQDLTKLDEQTLKKNLESNPSFEQDIISIVQGILNNVDSLYLENKIPTSNPQRLEIEA